MIWPFKRKSEPVERRNAGDRNYTEQFIDWRANYIMGTGGLTAIVQAMATAKEAGVDPSAALDLVDWQE